LDEEGVAEGHLAPVYIQPSFCAPSIASWKFLPKDDQN
jgi:hypothetical protein